MADKKEVNIVNWPAAVTHMFINTLQYIFIIAIILLLGHCDGCLVLPGLGPSKRYIQDTKNIPTIDTPSIKDNK